LPARAKTKNVKAIFCEAGRPASAGRLAAGQRRFRFLDLCIRFGKIISKVCDGFDSGARIKTAEKEYASEAPGALNPRAFLNGGIVALWDFIKVFPKLLYVYEVY